MLIYKNDAWHETQPDATAETRSTNKDLTNKLKTLFFFSLISHEAHDSAQMNFWNAGTTPLHFPVATVLRCANNV